MVAFGFGFVQLTTSITAMLLPSGAGALVVYGAPQAVLGAGGCLRDPRQEPATDQPCPGAAQGLAGAQAVAVSANGASVYVAGEGAVVALARNPFSGSLRPALSPSAGACVAASPGSPCAIHDTAVNGGDALAVSDDGRFVYVGATNTASVSAFVRGRHGELVPLAENVDGYFGCVSGDPLGGIRPARCAGHMGALAGVAAMAISPDGRYLYAVSYGLAPGEDSIVTLRRDPRGGGLRPLPGTRGCLQSLPGRGCRALAGLEGASAITISADGRFVYVASQLSGAVRGFLRDPRTGALTPLFGRGGCVSSGERAPGDVPCAVNVPQLSGARSIALSPDGRELYVAAFSPGAVVVLRRDPASGRLAPTAPDCLQAAPDTSCPVGLPSLRGAAALALAPGGTVLYVIGEGANSVVELLRNPTDGALTPTSAPASVVPGLSGPAALAISPGGGSLYVASPFENGVAALAR
jgi:DNA-binding beta-propeller fold protein YncE